MEEATFSQSTHNASPGPGELKDHISPGSTYCVLPWAERNGLTCLVIHSFTQPTCHQSQAYAEGMRRP